MYSLDDDKYVFEPKGPVETAVCDTLSEQTTCLHTFFLGLVKRLRRDLAPVDRRERAAALVELFRR